MYARLVKCPAGVLPGCYRKNTMRRKDSAYSQPWSFPFSWVQPRIISSICGHCPTCESCFFSAAIFVSIVLEMSTHVLASQVPKRYISATLLGARPAAARSGGARWGRATGDTGERTPREHADPRGNSPPLPPSCGRDGSGSHGGR